MAVDTSAIADGTRTSTGPRLIVVKGPGRGAWLAIPLEGLVIGRAPDCPAFAQDDTISRRHVEIRMAPSGSLLVTDLGSANGTFVNGQRVHGRVSVADGDVLRIGSTYLAMAAASDVAIDRKSLLAEGRRLLQAGDLVGSRRAFHMANANPDTAGSAQYGIGVVAMQEGDFARAEGAFLSAVELDPTDGNALFYLGHLAERMGDRMQAAEWYYRTLAVNPRHMSAQQGLAGLRRQLPPSRPQASGARNPVPPQPANPPANPPQPAHAMHTDNRWAITDSIGIPDVMGFLRQDNALISKQAVALMECLDATVRPRFIAYIGRYAGRATVSLFGILLIVAALGHFSRHTELLLLMFVLLAIAAILIAYLNVACMSLRIYQGRLQIERGVFHKRLQNIDLWRVLNVNLDRTLINRITGDGTLELTIAGDVTTDPRKVKSAGSLVRVTGLTSGKELQNCYQRLLNLAFLLRGNPVVKGIIQ